MTVVLANGCWDILHIGHLWHLEAAKDLGDKLIVSVTLDEFVNKGLGRPLHPWAHRAELLMGLKCVDDVVPSISGVDAVLKVRPDIFVKGKDYFGSPLLAPTIEACKQVGAKLEILDTPKLSSSFIYDRLRKS